MQGEQKGSARGSVHWGCYYATSLDIEVDPQHCCFGSRQSDFALQAVVECSALGGGIKDQRRIIIKQAIAGHTFKLVKIR
jgi:hypothetical protein